MNHKSGGASFRVCHREGHGEIFSLKAPTFGGFYGNVLHLISPQSCFFIDWIYLIDDADQVSSSAYIYNRLTAIKKDI